MRTIELILLENVENLGIVGDVVNVKPGYARNYLVPMGFATTPTEEIIQQLAARRAEVEKEMAELRKKQEDIVSRLEEYELTMERSANEQGVLFGGVSQHDIAEALREAGFDLEDRYVRIGEQIKRLDSYHIPIVINKELKAEIKLWVVSDKPMEELEPEDEEVEGEEGEEAVSAGYGNTVVAEEEASEEQA